MATTWGTGAIVPTQTTLEDTSRKVTCTDKQPHICDGGHVALSATTGSATRIVDMWHNDYGSNLSNIRLALYKSTSTTPPSISYISNGYAFGPINNYDYDNVDIYDFSTQTSPYQQVINLSAANSTHKIFAIHKAESLGTSANLFIGYSGNRTNTTSISAEYRRTYSYGYNAWAQYNQQQYYGDGIRGQKSYFSITVNAYNQFIVKQYPVYRGNAYTFNLHTFSENNYDGIIISKAPLSDNNFGNLKSNTNTITYCSGNDTKVSNVTYKPTESGYVYIYFKTDGSVLAGKNRILKSYTTTTTTTTTTPSTSSAQGAVQNQNQHHNPQYEYTDLYTYGDVDITCTNISFQIILNKCGGTGGTNRVEDTSSSPNLESQQDQEEIDDISKPTKYVNGSSGTAYTFLGYYTTKIGGEQYFDQNGECVHDLDLIDEDNDGIEYLYAHWGNTITSAGSWNSNASIYCTDYGYDRTTTDTTKTIQIRTSGATCINNSNGITYTLYNRPSGFTYINNSLNYGTLSISPGTQSGSYNISVIITSPGQDGSTPAGYMDDGGNYYFPVTYVKRYITVGINSVYATYYGPIGVDGNYNYVDNLSSFYVPHQYALIPATQVTLNTYNWESYFSIPTVWQTKKYNNNAVGRSAIRSWIFGGDYYGYEAHSFNNLGTTTLLNDSNIIDLAAPQSRTFVTDEVRNGILQWIYDWATEQGGIFTTSSQFPSPQDDLSFYGLDIEPVNYTSTTSSPWTGPSGTTSNHTNWNHNMNESGELVEYIWSRFGHIGLDDIMIDWLNFTTIYDVILYVQNSMRRWTDDETHEALIMMKEKVQRNRNIPTLQITSPASNVTLNLRSPGNTTTLTVKATYPSGSVENDVTASCTITSSPTGKVTIS